MNQNIEGEAKMNALLEQIKTMHDPKDFKFQQSNQVVSSDKHIMSYSKAPIADKTHGDFKQFEYTPIFGHDDSVAKMYFYDKEPQQIPQYSSPFVESYKYTSFDQEKA